MTEDEHPNERLVTPSEDGQGFKRSLVSRRDMLGGTALLAGLLAYTSDPTQPTNPNVGIAAASHNPDEPLIILGDEDDPIGYLFQDTAGGIILQDATSGNHFWYNQNDERWETDAEMNVPTLATEQVSIGDVADSTTVDLIRAVTGGGSDGGLVQTQPTDGVSTSATTILSPDVLQNFSANIVAVSGDEQGGNAFFTDAVLFMSGAGSPTTLGSIGSGTPAGRTYSRNTKDLDLAMASGTYDVRATALTAGGDAN